MYNSIHIAQAIANRVARGDRDFGRVAVKGQGGYVLLSYTQEAFYSGDFTDVEKACRGLVVSLDGRVMALPMEKFFNLGEPQCPPLPPDLPYTVYEKIDGSLAIFWHDGKRWRCNTRGSFDNIYVDTALSHWHYGGMFPERYTVMCEICIDDDEMQRAAYKPEGLYLLAIRDRYSGIDVPIDEFDMPKATRVNRSLDEILSLKSEVDGREGWVVRYDDGFRVKIKIAWYLRVFRAMQSLTPKGIKELMIEGGEDWVNEFPDDLRAEALEIQHEIEEKYTALLNIIYDAYSKVAHIKTRKEFALTVLRDYPNISRWLFNLRDDKFNPLDVLRDLEL